MSTNTLNELFYIHWNFLICIFCATEEHHTTYNISYYICFAFNHLLAWTTNLSVHIADIINLMLLVISNHASSSWLELCGYYISSFFILLLVRFICIVYSYRFIGNDGEEDDEDRKNEQMTAGIDVPIWASTRTTGKFGRCPNYQPFNEGIVLNLWLWWRWE